MIAANTPPPASLADVYMNFASFSTLAERFNPDCSAFKDGVAVLNEICRQGPRYGFLVACI
ncbi:MAG: hypothetical protein EBR81_12355 [Proteobacteria bacterium]|nr:hypothetical protein [Pseudomonadota bacterium]